MTLSFLAVTFVPAMSSAGEIDLTSSKPSIFLSYASEDRLQASSIRDVLVAAGLEVWYDENELGGGDAWDKKIRQQIRECDYFMAVISARTEARHEGYFRREWRLAVERTLDMADDHPFLLPVVIDNTDQATARVPERFLAVQWLKVPEGKPTASLNALCARLIAGEAAETTATRRAPPRIRGASARPPIRAMPVFPTEEPGQRVKFWFQVVGWSAKSAGVNFQRLPRWLRLIVYAWLFFLVIARSCSSDRPTSRSVPADTAHKLSAIAQKYQGSSKKEDIAKLGVDIAREFATEGSVNDTEANPILAVPFTAASENAAEAKLADSTFALLYGRISISHPGRVGLSNQPLSALTVDSALKRGRESRSSYVIFGGIENLNGLRVLDIQIIKVSDGSVISNNSYAVTTADPAIIAPQIEAEIPSLEED